MLNFEKLETEFRKKSFEEMNAAKYHFAIAAKYVLQMVCIAFGFYYIYQYTMPLFENQYIGVLSAIVFLTGIEVLKQIRATQDYREYLISNKAKFSSMAITMLVFFASVFVSKNGSELLYQHSVKRPILIEYKDYIGTLDSQLQEANDQLSYVQKTMIWDNGTLTTEGRKAYNALTAKTTTLQNKIDSVAKFVALSNRTTEDRHDKEVKAKATNLSWFVALFDAVLIACLLYPIYYRKKVYDERIVEKTQKIDKKKQKETHYPTREEEECRFLGDFIENITKSDDLNNASDYKKDKAISNNKQSLKIAKDEFHGLSDFELKKRRKNLMDTVRRWSVNADLNKDKIDKHLDSINKIDRVLKVKK